MNKSHLVRLVIPALIAALTAVSPDVWADRDKHQRNGRHEERQREERQRQYPSEQAPSSRNWDRQDARPNRRSQRDSNPLNSRLYDDRSKYSGYDRRSPRPVNDVIREVQDRYGGQVIGVQHNDGETYRVRVLQRDGRVKNVLVPAE